MRLQSSARRSPAVTGTAWDVRDYLRAVNPHRLFRYELTIVASTLLMRVLVPIHCLFRLLWASTVTIHIVSYFVLRVFCALTCYNLPSVFELGKQTL